MTKHTIAQKYIPGQCNIGASETKKRIRMGYAGLAGVILVIAGIELLHLPPVTRLVVFIPALFLFSGFLQANQKFCLLYGAFGVFSISGKRVKVTDETKLNKDRKKALKIILLVLLGSAGLALTYFSI